MDNKAFDSQRIAEGYAKRPWLHKEVMKQIRKDCNIERLNNGLDVGCGAGLSTKALRMLCEHVTGTDISSEMIAVCKQIYKDSSYTFYVSKAEENKIPLIPYDIITAAGVVNWIDKDLFLNNAEKILDSNGLIIIYDFWITDRMDNNYEYTEWFRDKYLKMFPKPYRKEDVWKQIDLTDAFKMEDKVAYDLKYEFSLDEFVDFMMIQSNVNEQIKKGFLSVEEIRNWMISTLLPIFSGQKKTLIFEGYNWYIRKR
ncbi:MAG: methyltransferase domain-containing protein [Lachnospiraceae bacterium]|nr:methyltransferase domain-containing protein [Lachnospiraceae bacterium]